MDLFQKEVKEEIRKLRKDFLSLKKLKRLTTNHEDKLIIDITGLIGLYNMGYDEEIRQLISQMISFGESKLWAMQGSQYQFRKLNKKYKK